MDNESKKSIEPNFSGPYNRFIYALISKNHLKSSMENILITINKERTLNPLLIMITLTYTYNLILKH